MSAQLISSSVPMDQEDETQPNWFLKKLSPKHKQVCALVAQGVDRSTIGSILQITPEYVTMLMRQPLCREYILGMNEVVGLRLEAMFAQSVEVISEAMQQGNVSEKLKGARLQLEVTKRLGTSVPLTPLDPTVDRLEALANRLTGLLGDQRRRQYDENAEEVEFTEINASPSLTWDGNNGNNGEEEPIPT